MNLENLNLVELSAQEVNEIEGGLWWVPILGAYLAWEIVGNPSASWAAFQAGYNSNP
ncbi:class IIb bacteriocin, lactobin A/cerein 7B family [Flavobacterium sp.]|uniref:class IIb bacteriocin, lactobin A/cerein 7B family n=1 Tax=Flavobacterium sp. TaxID=239 RepID=UPI00374DA324